MRPAASAASVVVLRPPRPPAPRRARRGVAALSPEQALNDLLWRSHHAASAHQALWDAPAARQARRTRFKRGLVYTLSHECGDLALGQALRLGLAQGWPVGRVDWRKTKYSLVLYVSARTGDRNHKSRRRADA